MNWFWGCLLLCYALVCQIVCGMGVFPMPFLPLEGFAHFEMISNNFKLLLHNDELYASLVNILQLLDTPPDGDVSKLLLDSATVSNVVNAIDKDSILSVLSLPSDKFQQFLASHPEWSQSASSFTQKFVDAKIKPVIDQQTSSILDGFYSYLNANPDLKLSASEYAVKFWQTNVLTKSKETIDFLAVSPLAKNTAAFIESIQSYHPPMIDTTSTVPKLDFSGSEKLGAAIGEKINDNFNNWLNSNPKLKLSASEFTKDFVETEIFPRYEKFYSVYRKSPLAQATNRFTSTSTTEFTSEVVSTVGEKVKPLTDGIAYVTKRLVDKTLEPFANTVQSIATTTRIPSTTTSTTTMPTTFQPNLEPLSVASDKLSSFAAKTQEFLTKQSTLLSSNIPQLPSVDELLTTTTSSLARANEQFTSQLLTKTQVFNENTVNFFEQFAFQVGKVTTDAVTVLPKRSLQLLEENSKNPMLKVDIFDETKSQVFLQSEVLKNRVLQTLEEAQKWKLFSDENHLQNGYWEQRFADVSSFVDKVTNSDSERMKIGKEITARLSLAQENFLRQWEVAQSQSPINQALMKLQKVDFSKAQQTNEEFQMKVAELKKQLEVTTESLKGQWQGLQSLLKEQKQ